MFFPACSRATCPAPVPSGNDRLEERGLANHLLHPIDCHMPFDFSHDATAHVYCTVGSRPVVDPVRLFKMRFVGYRIGIIVGLLLQAR